MTSRENELASLGAQGALLWRTGQMVGGAGPTSNNGDDRIPK